MKFSIYRYNPEIDPKPYNQEYEIDPAKLNGFMLLDALIGIKNTLDESLSFRRSCGEGVCGSDGMNINGKNGLACITPLKLLEGKTVVIRPLPGLPVVRDLIVDMSNFFKQYERVRPFLIHNGPVPAAEYLQTPEQRATLDGLYECILCACCSSACPSFWWNPDKFVGPAAALQAARFIEDSRDDDTQRRLSELDDAYSVLRCRTIMNCADVCPKGLNPSKAIGDIRRKMLKNENPID
jgi:succinate dehydrogenase / fumarate reductase iron-sulfur subunit